ncbi:MAG: HEPN domain-containing protein [Oscillospiraceae bacterium]|nr:HEPN domain-containing protein [Oscillospiraceae bacterium]
MPDDNRESLMLLRLEKAEDCLRSAIREAKAKAYKSAANRSYYCILHAIRAVLALDCFDSKRHSAVISEFGRRYIKEGDFPKDFSKMIQRAFEVRNDSDYDDFYVISKNQVDQQIISAKTILKAVEDYLKTL